MSSTTGSCWIPFCHPVVPAVAGGVGWELDSGLPAIALATAGIHGLVSPTVQLQKFGINLSMDAETSSA